MNEDHERRARFERLTLQHLDAAYNLARWLTHNDHDAQDVVQEAFERAMRYIGTFRGDNARAWLLQTVRNTCFTWMKENRPGERLFLEGTDDEAHELAAPAADEPPALAMRRADRQQINQAMADLPVVYREVLVLRELEELSYGDIARVVDIPIGTVMSRLARARGLMREALMPAVRPVLRPVPRTTQSGGTL